jgi:hypothetical protein
MRNLGSSFSRFLVGLVAGAVIASVLAGIAVKVFRARGAPLAAPLLLKQGFDFT